MFMNKIFIFWLKLASSTTIFNINYICRYVTFCWNGRWSSLKNVNTFYLSSWSRERRGAPTRACRRRRRHLAPSGGGARPALRLTRFAIRTRVLTLIAYSTMIKCSVSTFDNVIGLQIIGCIRQLKSIIILVTA